MRKIILPTVILTVILIALFVTTVLTPASACTNMLVTRGASADGSVMITYTCDGEFHPRMSYTLPEDYEPGDSLELRNNAVLRSRRRIEQAHGTAVSNH